MPDAHVHDRRCPSTDPSTDPNTAHRRLRISVVPAPDHPQFHRGEPASRTLTLCSRVQGTHWRLQDRPLPQLVPLRSLTQEEATRLPDQCPMRTHIVASRLGPASHHPSFQPLVSLIAARSPHVLHGNEHLQTSKASKHSNSPIRSQARIPRANLPCAVISCGRPAASAGACRDATGIGTLHTRERAALHLAPSPVPINKAASRLHGEAIALRSAAGHAQASSHVRPRPRPTLSLSAAINARRLSEIAPDTLYPGRAGFVDDFLVPRRSKIVGLDAGIVHARSTCPPHISIDTSCISISPDARPRSGATSPSSGIMRHRQEADLASHPARETASAAPARTMAT